MNISQFNEKYKDKGGFATLSEFKNNLETLLNIAKHFGVSKERAKQWMVEFYGENYDPRKERRESSIQVMLDFAKDHTEEEFNEAFSLHNEDYKLEAWYRANNLKLFKNKKDDII